MNLLAIDPSLACTGFAVFRESRLDDAWVCSTRPGEMYPRILQVADEENTHGFWNSVVIEWPQIYPRAHGKGQDPNDLLAVAAVVGAIIARVNTESVELVHPAKWKGQVPKEIHNARVLKRLLPEETRRLPTLSASKMHNAIDAIGIGLWALKRM